MNSNHLKNLSCFSLNTIFSKYKNNYSSVFLGTEVLTKLTALDLQVDEKMYYFACLFIGHFVHFSDLALLERKVR